MKTIKKALIVSLILSIVACTHLRRTPPEPVDAQQQRKQLQQFNQWRINGAVAVKNTKEAWHANLYWQLKDRKHYQFKLYGPLGSHQIRLQRNGKFVDLQTADKQHARARSAKELLLKYTGWDFPLENLYYWIRGLPAPKQDFQQRLDQHHRLVHLKQGDWSLDYLGYKNIKGLNLPTRIDLRHHALRVRIVVRRWLTQ